MSELSKHTLELKKWRASQELKSNLRKTLGRFKSKEEPSIRLTRKEKAKVLSNLLSQYI